jgi:hypothetical protein
MGKKVGNRETAQSAPLNVLDIVHNTNAKHGENRKLDSSIIYFFAVKSFAVGCW